MIICYYNKNIIFNILNEIKYITLHSTWHHLQHDATCILCTFGDRWSMHSSLVDHWERIWRVCQS